MRPAQAAGGPVRVAAAAARQRHLQPCQRRHLPRRLRPGARTSATQHPPPSHHLTAALDAALDGAYGLSPPRTSPPLAVAQVAALPARAAGRHQDSDPGQRMSSRGGRARVEGHRRGRCRANAGGGRRGGRVRDRGDQRRRHRRDSGCAGARGEGARSGGRPRQGARGRAAAQLGCAGEGRAAAAAPRGAEREGRGQRRGRAGALIVGQRAGGGGVRQLPSRRDGAQLRRLQVRLLKIGARGRRQRWRRRHRGGQVAGGERAAVEHAAQQLLVRARLPVAGPRDRRVPLPVPIVAGQFAPAAQHGASCARELAALAGAAVAARRRPTCIPGCQERLIVK